MSLILNTPTTFSGKDLTSPIQIGTYSPTSEYLLGVRVDLGAVGGYLNVGASTLTFVAKINGTIAYSQTVSKASGQSTYFYNYDRLMLVRPSEVFTVWVQSDNASDVSISGNVFIVGSRSSGGVLATTERSDMIDWIKNEFAPRTFAMSDSVISQQIDNAIRYFNVNSGYKIMETVAYNGTTVVQLSTEFKQVVEVIPGQATTWLWKDHPLLTLLGLQVLDNVTSDIILMTESFKMYRDYVGTNFHFQWVKSEDPTVGGRLFIRNPPSGITSLTVVGTKRILPGESIKQEYIQDWILRYAKALAFMIQGTSIRIGRIIGVQQDGDELVSWATEEIKALKEELKRNGLWVCLAKRR